MRSVFDLPHEKNAIDDLLKQLQTNGKSMIWQRWEDHKYK